MAKATKKQSAAKVADQVNEDVQSVVIEEPKFTVLNPETVANAEIAKLDVGRFEIEKWAKEFPLIKVSSLEDKKVYKQLREAKSVLRSSRTFLDKGRLKLTEPLRDSVKTINDEVKKYISKIEDIEVHVDAEIEKYEGWKREEEERIEREAQTKLNGRVEKLLEAGIAFNGTYYAINSVAIDVATLRIMEDADFSKLVAMVCEEKAKNDAAEQARLEAELQAQREREEEAKRLEEEAQRQEEERKKLEEEKRQIEAEKEQMRKDKIAMRAGKCDAIGMSFSAAAMSYYFKNKYTEQTITKEQIETLDNQSFEAVLSECAKYIEIALNNQRAAEKKEQELNQQVSQRVSKLNQLGITAGDYSDSFSQLSWRSEFHPSIVKKLTFNTGEFLFDFTEQQFSEQLEHAKVHVENLIARVNEAQSKLIAIGYVFDAGNNAVYNFNGEIDRVPCDVIAQAINEDRIDEVVEVCKGSIKMCQDNHAKKLAEVEKARQDAMSDVERMTEYMKAIRAIEVPDFNTEAMLTVYAQLEETFSFIEVQLESIN